MNPEQLSQRLQSLGPNTQVEVMDLTGTQDHYQALLVSSQFEGRRSIDRHRLVLALVEAEIQSGELHALTLKTFTPAEYAQLLGNP